MTDYQIILCTCADDEQSRTHRPIAWSSCIWPACVNILPGVHVHLPLAGQR